MEIQFFIFFISLLVSGNGLYNYITKILSKISLYNDFSYLPIPIPTLFVQNRTVYRSNAGRTHMSVQ